MPHVHIRSVGTAVPGRPIKNDEIESRVGFLPPDILEGLQVSERHWAIDPDTGEHLTSNSALAADAGRAAVEQAGLVPGDVDLIVVSTASPEYQLPNASGMVAERLGLSRVMTLDVRAGCSGFVQALDTARLHLAAGNARRALVIGVEVISPVLYPLYHGKDSQRIRMRDRIAAYTFGDGAGAVLLERIDAANTDTDTDTDTDTASRDISPAAHATMGGQKKPGMKIIGGGTHAPMHQQQNAKQLVTLTVDVVESGRFIPQMLVDSIDHFFDRTGQSPQDIDLMVIPEGNAGYVTSELEAAGLATSHWRALEPKVYENIAQVAATGSAAVPLALGEAVRTGRVRPGDNVALLAIETSKWTYGALSFRWDG